MLYSASKVTAASNGTPFFPLNPLMSLVVPEEKSCSRWVSVSSLFRIRRNTSSPHPSWSHLATLERRMIFPVLHLGQVNALSCIAGKSRRRISSVALRV